MLCRLLLLGTALAILASPAAAREHCARVDPAALVPEVALLDPPLSINLQGDDRLRWAAIRWMGPPSGTVLVLDCAGKPLAALDLGYVERLRAGPRLPGGATVEVIYVSGHGTGVRMTSVALLQWRDGAIRQLWSHPAKDTIAMAAPKTVNTYRWRYLEGPRRIAVTGRRTAGVATTLGAEMWCQPAEGSVFRRCDPSGASSEVPSNPPTR